MPLGLLHTSLDGSPASGASGPLADLVTLATELLSPSLVDAELLAEATRNAFPSLSGVVPGFGRQPHCDWGLGFEIRDGKAPHWTGSRNSPATFGHFGLSGSFLWVDPDAGIACIGLADRDFGPWAAQGWPRLSDDVLASYAVRRSSAPASQHPGPDRDRVAAAAVLAVARPRLLSVYFDDVKPPSRLPIPTCMGCRAMRQYQKCEGACRERELELVSGSDYDELTAAAAARRLRIQGLLAVVEELARKEPGPQEWRAAYEALQETALSVLRPSGLASGGRDDDLPSQAETVIVWRCQDCGGLDAPQPCIDVCIWRPVDWVDGTSYESKRSQAAFDFEVEQSLAGLLRRLAFATPRGGQWERSWRAFQSQARLALQSRRPRSVANETAIRQARADG